MIKVLIVDDSLLIRKLLNEILSRDPLIEVVAMAEDPFDAREKIKLHKPDVVTLDVEMPRMNGIQFLSNLMRLHPLPVVMISTLTEEGAEVTLNALEIGAVDFICKPKINVKNELEKYADELLAKVRSAASAKLRPFNARRAAPEPQRVMSQEKSVKITDVRAREYIIGIGSSTGGIEALNEILPELASNLPPIVITQHIPHAFSERFAKRMNNVIEPHVQLAEENMALLPGHIYVAPGDRHLVVKKINHHYKCQLSDGAEVSGHKPSADVMFDSIANAAGTNAIGVLLTGMGSDGAKGLKNMLQSGANTIVQDEKTSVVWGMPGSAAKIGAAEKELPLGKIAQYINQQVVDKLTGAKRSAA